MSKTQSATNKRSVESEESFQSVRETLESTIGKAVQEETENDTDTDTDQYTEDLETELPQEDTPLDQEASDEEGEDEKEENTTEAEEEEVEEVEEDTDDFEAPEHWKAEEKETFRKLPADLKQFYLTERNQVKTEAGKKWEEAAELRKTYEPIKQVFEPYKDQLAMQGLDELSLVKQYAAYHNALQTNPKQTIEYLARQYNVDLGAPAQQGNQEETYVDPELAEIKNELNRIKQQNLSSEQQQQSRYISERMSWIEDFKTQKDSSGKPLYPDFQSLESEISRYIRPTTSREETHQVLKDAYDRAVWASPNTRQARLEEEKKIILEAEKQANISMLKKAQEKELAAQRHKAAKAKRVGKSLSKSGSSANGDMLSVRESLQKYVSF